MQFLRSWKFQFNKSLRNLPERYVDVDASNTIKAQIIRSIPYQLGNCFEAKKSFVSCEMKCYDDRSRRTKAH